jgi:hypothetical protein
MYQIILMLTSLQSLTIITLRILLVINNGPFGHNQGSTGYGKAGRKISSKSGVRKTKSNNRRGGRKQRTIIKAQGKFTNFDP